MSTSIIKHKFISSQDKFIQPPILPRFLIISVIFISSINHMACTSILQPTPTRTVRPIVTAMVALMSGELIEINGCVRVKDSDSNDGYALVWPPDFKMTIEDDQIKVVSGLVSGQHLERVIKIGELVKLGGGIVGNPDEQLRGTIPSDCIGPYWVVGSNFLPLSPTPTPK